MAAKSPIRYVFDTDGNVVEFSEFQAADFIAISDGGTGAVEVKVTSDKSFKPADKATVGVCPSPEVTLNYKLYLD